MFKLSHTTLIVISGLVWLGVGFFLFSLGLNLIVESTHLDLLAIEKHSPILETLAPYFGMEQAALLLVVLCLAAGYAKGRFVLGKSARRGVARILTFSNPTSIANIYSRSYYLLLALMIGLGMSIKFLGLPDDVRGAVDVTIGAALINGAMIYFKLASALRQKMSQTG